MSRFALRLVDQARSVGPWRLARVAPSWLFRPKFVVVVRDLSAPLPPFAPTARWVRRPIEADLAQVERVDPIMTLREVRRRLDEGQHGFVWWLDGVPVHVRWFATGPVFLPYLGLTVRPGPGDVFLVSIRTRMEFRRRGLEGLAGLDSLHEAQASGFHRMIAVVAWWNTPPLRAAQRLGYRAAGWVGFWNLLLARRPFAAGLARIEGPDVFSILDETVPAEPSGP